MRQQSVENKNINKRNLGTRIRRFGLAIFVGAAVLWVALSVTHQISWISCLALGVVAANYLLLSLAVAFRNFARLASRKMSARASRSRTND